MRCEFLVSETHKGGRPKIVGCGQPAKYFVTRGGIGETWVWLCSEHERYCTTFFRWYLREVDPPEVATPDPGATEVSE